MQRISHDDLANPVGNGSRRIQRDPQDIGGDHAHLVRYDMKSEPRLFTR